MTVVVRTVRNSFRYQIDFCIAQAATDVGMEYDNEWDAPLEYLRGTHLLSEPSGRDLEVKVDYNDSLTVLTLSTEDDLNRPDFDTKQNEVFLKLYANQIVRRLEQIKRLPWPQSACPKIAATTTSVVHSVAQPSSSAMPAMTKPAAAIAPSNPLVSPALSRPPKTIAGLVERKSPEFDLWHYVQIIFIVGFAGYIMMAIGSAFWSHGLPASTGGQYSPELYENARR